MKTASTATESAGPETTSALPQTIASPPVIGPVLGQERIEAIDILRGVAILGILIVNMCRFSLPEDLPAHQLAQVFPLAAFDDIVKRRIKPDHHRDGRIRVSVTDAIFQIVLYGLLELVSTFLKA